MSDQTVKLDAWTLEWLLGAAKRELESCTDERRKFWLSRAVSQGEAAWKRWESPSTFIDNEPTPK